MRLASALLALVGGLIFAAPNEVSADAIRAPGTCPEPGWVARRVGHGGWCFPRTCESDADCPGGGSCEAVRRCWRESTYSAGRRRFRPDEPRPTRARPGDRCPEGTCSQDEATCRPPTRECVYGPEFSRASVWERGDDTPAPERIEPEPEPEPDPEPEPAAVEPSEAPASAASSSSAAPTQADEGGCAASNSRHGAMLLFAALLLVRRRR